MKLQSKLTFRLALVLCILLALAAVTTAAAGGYLKTFPLVAGDTIELGKQGITVGNVPFGVSHVLAGVRTDPLPPRFHHNVEIEHRSPVVEVRFLNTRGGTIEDIAAQVYVFFNIGKAEKALWEEEGRLGISIWYIDDDLETWVECPAFFINENRDNGTFDRLACLAPGSGYYVLGHVEFDELLFNPYTVDNQLVIQQKFPVGMN